MHVVISTVEENMNNNNLIIVAEDDDDIAAILTGYLRKPGMKTLRAEDGEQAINLTPVSYTHLDVYKRQIFEGFWRSHLRFDTAWAI